MTLIAFINIKDCPNNYLCEKKYATSIAYKINDSISENK
jgi:hypothetical protein